MNIDLKKHLRFEAIVMILTGFLILCLADEMSLFIKLFGICCVVGIFNVLYVFGKVLKNNSHKTIIIFIIFLFTFGMQWILYSLLAIPIIILEIFYVSIGKIYVGMNSSQLNRQSKNNANILETLQEENIYNEVIIKLKQRKILKLVLLSIVLSYIYIINELKIDDYLLYSLYIVIILSCSMLYFFIYKKTIIKIDEILYKVLSTDCDSRSYYHICKALHNKYPNNYLILKYYFIALRFDKNDYSELRTILNEYKNYEKQIFYKIALIESLNESEKEKVFQKNFQEIKNYNESLNKKNKHVNFESNIKYLDIQNMLYQKNYVTALNICESIEIDDSKFDLVRKVYLKGKCLMKLGKTCDAITAFEFVVKEGNTLRMKYNAIAYLKELEN